MHQKKRQHDPIVLFLEDEFGSGEHPDALRDAGYDVRCFRDVFPAKPGKPEQLVKDDRIIKRCDKEKWSLITTDKNMLYTHNALLRTTEIAVIATANNHGDPKEWVAAIIKSKVQVDRFIRTEPRPSFATISRGGVLTVKPVVKRGQRRLRPKEGQQR